MKLCHWTITKATSIDNLFSMKSSLCKSCNLGTEMKEEKTGTIEQYINTKELTLSPNLT